MILKGNLKEAVNKSYVERLLGNRYSFICRLKNSNCRSNKMSIPEWLDSSGALDQIAELSCFIELRPTGILIHLKQSNQNFLWPIPFYQLIVYKTKVITLHADGKFIRFHLRDFNLNNSFFRKMMRAKGHFMKTDCPPSHPLNGYYGT